jgi:hypothetical protein
VSNVSDATDGVDATHDGRGADAGVDADDVDAGVDADDADAGVDATGDPRAHVEAAIRDVRREGYKAAAIYAVADASLAAVVAAAAVRFAGPGRLPEAVSLPLGGDPATLTTAAVAAVLAWVVVGPPEFALRVRRPLVERFGAANPEMAEALRTARDAVEAGRDGPMARRLYADVLADLRGASSAGLVDATRVALTVVLVVGVGVAGVQVAVLGIDVAPLPADGDAGAGAGPGTGAGANGTNGEFDGLEDGSQVLGDPEDVTAGDNPQNATVDPVRAGGEEAGPPPSSYEESGFSSAVEGQRAGYVDEERPEDADLIREYNLAIREGDAADGADDGADDETGDDDA